MDSDWMASVRHTRDDSGYKSMTEADNPLVVAIRASVVEYRRQSPLHFALNIDVQAEDQSLISDVYQGAQCRIALETYTTKIIRTGRFLIRKQSVTNKVQIREKGKWISVTNSLSKHFPACDADANMETLRAFWDSTECTFEWTGLPNELKEHVFQFCIFQDGRYNLTNLVTAKKYRCNDRRPHEILRVLGEWSGLLGASQQVRALVLRLLLKGNIHVRSGLILRADGYPEFRNAISRLRKSYQMIHSNGVPVDDW